MGARMWGQTSVPRGMEVKLPYKEGFTKKEDPTVPASQVPASSKPQNSQGPDFHLSSRIFFPG